MTPRELIGVAEVPGGLPLRLIRHGRDFIIMLERNELMSSRMNGSEEALALMTIERLRASAPLLLVGGYGMGFTLRAALGVLGPQARATVVELVPEVLDWARGPMAEMTGACLNDPRVTLRIGDVGAAIREAPEAWDAILLDVDNGPDGVTRQGNDGLYAGSGLTAAHAALRRGGILAIWSAGPDPGFTRRLKQAGFEVEEARVRARQNGKGPIHTIWFARKR